MLNKLLRKKQRKARSNKSSNDDATTSTAASTATGASSPPKKSTTTRRGLDDSFPEITQLPEFYNDELLYKNGDNDNDDLSVLSRHSSNQYDTKEDQDVAVFMALAGRKNLDSLLFILQGHARELNLPSAECLLPVNAAKIKAERAAAAAAAEEEVNRKPIKQFRWKEAEDNYNGDGDGSGMNTQVACQVFEIESIKDCKDAWWSDDEMHTILTSAIKDVKYYQEHKKDYMQAVQTLATQSDGNNNNNNNKSQTESNMKAVINDRHGRGLEVHIVGYLERTRQEYVDAVLDQQDACEDDNESYQTICDKLRQTSLTFSKQSSSWALKLAKCDHIVALKASLSKWEKPTTKQTQTQTNSKSRLPKRCGSGRVKPSCEGVITDI